NPLDYIAIGVVVRRLDQHELKAAFDARRRRQHADPEGPIVRYELATRARLKAITKLLQCGRKADVSRCSSVPRSSVVKFWGSSALLPLRCMKGFADGLQITT